MFYKGEPLSLLSLKIGETTNFGNLGVLWTESEQILILHLKVGCPIVYWGFRASGLRALGCPNFGPVRGSAIYPTYPPVTKQHTLGQHTHP